MFVGHGAAAFALVGAAALSLGADRRQALRVAVVAGLFATAPDVDILYGPFGLLNGVSGVFDATDAFWSAGNVVHRGPTHSMVLGLVTAVAVGVWGRSIGRRVLSAGLLSGVVVVGTAYSGSLAGAVTVLFALSALALGVLARRYGVSSRAVFASAAVGLLSHPLGDLLTGEPPALLYPLDVTLVAERVTLSSDATLHLLGAFGVELAIIWLAVGVHARLTERRLPRLIDRTAGLGVAYAGAAVLLPAPTLDTSYHFVFTVLGFGALCATQRELLTRRLRAFDWFRGVATGLAAVTVAVVGYLVVYLAV